MDYKEILGITGPFKPVPSVSSYDHFKAWTPLGDLIIEYKSWKDQDSRLITIGQTQLDVYPYTDEEAFEEAYKYLESKCLELKEYLKLT